MKNIVFLILCVLTFLSFILHGLSYAERYSVINSNLEGALIRYDKFTGKIWFCANAPTLKRFMCTPVMEFEDRTENDSKETKNGIQ